MAYDSANASQSSMYSCLNFLNRHGFDEPDSLYRLYQAHMIICIYDKLQSKFIMVSILSAKCSGFEGCAVVVVMNMVNASKSMRYFLKGGNSSSLVQFSSTTEDDNDTGDCGEVVVFRIWSMSSFGKALL
ncbi:hypothetical protein V6N13_086446 [Hibiscus sabdariffa]|uniref:Uncharacterized protein n=1 Tax=Hibiscus sabdariffa TaxID=183260 RepID=A0ABR2FTB1_9ROSI